MKFARTGLATLGLFTLVAAGCPQPTHKKNDAGIDDMGGEGGDGGDGGTGGDSGAGGSSGSGGSSTGGSGGSSTGGSGGSGTGGSGGDSGSGGSSGTGGSSGSGGSSGTGGASGDGGAGGSSGAGGSMMPDAGGSKDTGGGMATGASMAGFMPIYTNIISKQCGPCHTTNTSGGLSMKDAATAFKSLVGVKGSTNCMMQVRVVPGDPGMSLLVKKLSSATPGCGAQMPKGKTPLDAATLKMITDWITSG